MTEQQEYVEGELLPDVVVEPPARPLTLFGTSDPTAALHRMSEIASVLVDVIKDRRLFVRIQGHDHITAEGWTTLGGMLGVVPVVVWTKPNETGDGYLARVEARTLDGTVVGAAESECSRAERRWKTADPYAIRSMAQTRAIGRALRAPLGQIVVLAGYEPAGAEELPGDAAPAAAPVPNSKIPPAIQPTAEQQAQLRDALELLGAADPGRDWPARCREIVGVPWEMATATMVDRLLAQLHIDLQEMIGDRSEA